MVAQRHLKSFEELLTREILFPVRDALRDHLSHIEEFDYLYLHVHKIFSEILAHYRDFKSQPAFMFNPYIQNFEYKLLGFIRLLEKRKGETFIPLNRNEWQVMHDRSQQSVKDIQDTIADNVQQYRDLKKYINAQMRQQAIEAKKFKFKKFWSKDNSAEEIERHYAFPSGDNGLTRLPVLIHLPETYDGFDVEDFNASMSLDMNFSTASKVQVSLENTVSFKS